MSIRLWIIAGTVAAGLVASLVLLSPSSQPAVKAGENGTFANDCCGTIALADGKMLLNDSRSVRYTVARDAQGPYVLPKSYVGIVPYEGFEVDGTRSTVKLRLDRLPGPTSIEVYWGPQPFVFTRERPRAPSSGP